MMYIIWFAVLCCIALLGYGIYLFFKPGDKKSESTPGLNSQPIAKKSNTRTIIASILLVISCFVLFMLVWPSLSGASSHKVTYEITGSASRVMVTMMKGDGGMEQGYYNLPFKKEYEVKPGVPLSLVAQNQSDSGNVSCHILVDGNEVNTATSIGAYVIVTCSGLAQ